MYRLQQQLKNMKSKLKIWEKKIGTTRFGKQNGIGLEYHHK